MRASIIEWAMGILAFDGKNRVIESMLFPMERQDAAEAIASLQSGEVTEGMAELINRLIDKDFREFVFESEELAREVRRRFKVEASVEKPSPAGRFLRRNPAGVAVEIGCVQSEEEYYRIVHEVSNSLASRVVRRESSRKDLLISQAVNALEDLDKTLNLFSNRVKEWYGLYFPELARSIERNDLYLRLIASLKRRGRFTVERLIREGLEPEKAEEVDGLAEASMGGDLDDEDLNQVQGLAKEALKLDELRSGLEKYIDGMMKKVAPNVRCLAGPLLGARLIAFVGGLENLAKRSASKIQVLGAEKALYRSFRTGAKPPKHGLIFQHRAVHSAPRWQRGKIARVLAGKIAIAARIDVYHGGFKGEELMEAFKKRLKEVKKRYGKPPHSTRNGV